MGQGGRHVTCQILEISMSHIRFCGQEIIVLCVDFRRILISHITRSFMFPCHIEYTSVMNFNYCVGFSVDFRCLDP